MKKTLIIFTLSLFLIGFSTQSFAQNDDKLVVLHTNLGNITIEFFPNDAPNHVSNFIKLAESGFYDGTLFHRIIPGFMIQGGDPKTKSDSGAPQSEWGTGGPDQFLDAEFNTIKHNRGIVSMARAQDPNSAGSQFFIVHKDSNFLDQQYTVFGRIINQESFDTLDKIASVETTTRDIPVDIEQVRIIKAEVISRSELSDVPEWVEPERMAVEVEINEFQPYNNEEFGFSISLPVGWQIQEPSKSQEGAPDISVVGTKKGIIPPTFSITVEKNSEKSFDEKITDLDALIKQNSDQGNMINVTNKKEKIGNYNAYVIQGIIPWNVGGGVYPLQFKEAIISIDNDFYTINYYNDKNYFNNNLDTFETTLNSFKTKSEGGGCLIATATFGSELAPQVQQLRELRDNTILSTESGTAFMTGFNQLYYSFSPTIADMERENPIFKETVKIALTPMLSSLTLLNYADIDSEQEMLAYGIGIIAMNVGMYIAAPAMIVYRIRK